MTDVEPRTRSELAREIVAAVGGALAAAVAVVVQHADWPRPIQLLVVAGWLLVLFVVARVLPRRRPARPRLTRSNRRLMNRALRDMGRLPDSADEAWRPALRRAAIGYSFSACFIYSLAALAVASLGPLSTDDIAGSPLQVVALASFLVVGAVMLAGVFSHVSRGWSPNAQNMLDQLEARPDAGSGAPSARREATR